MKRWLVVVALLGACKDKDEPDVHAGSGSNAASALPCTQAPVVQLPTIAGASEVESGPIVAASLTEITLDCRLVTAVPDGNRPDRRLEPLVDALAAHAMGSPGRTLLLSLDHRLTYGLLIDILFSAKQKEAGWKRFALLVHGERGLPITLPDKRPPPDLVGEPTGDPPLQMIVTATKREVRVWSISQLEGSIAEPKLAVPRDAEAAKKVESALREIVLRRWPSQRPEDSREIILMADEDVPVQTIAELIGAMRPSFPDVRLSMGFE